MAQVWELPLPPMEKLVLLALADCANDEGQCWPSATTLARKTGEGERTVRRAVQALIAKKFLEQRQRSGTSAVYTVHPCQSGTPARAAPLPDGPETPAAEAPKPSGTVIEEEREERERAILKLPQWRAFKAMRRQIKKPVNDTAERRLLAKLLALDDAGYPPGEVLDQSTEYCWQGVFEIEDQSNGRQANRGSVGRMGGPRADPTLELVRAATAAQRQDRGDHGEARLALPASKLG